MKELEFANIALDRDSVEPVYRQLGDALYKLISSGKLQPDIKLPPIRRLAEILSVNNVTVVSAYKYLEQKKAVYSRVGSGTYVSEIPPEELPKSIFDMGYDNKKNLNFDIKGAINFANSSVSPELFPVGEFKRFFNEVLDRDRGNAFSYTDSLGYEPLRDRITSYLEEYGIKTDVDKIQIISGAQQGIDLIAKVVLNQGDVVFVERPTYYGAIGAFLSRGAQIIEIPMQKDGVDLQKLNALAKLYSPKLIYAMAYFQTPTCNCYSMEKKRALLEVAAQNNAYILEEDSLSEFNYTKEQIIPLKALDYKNRVIYIKSFSKILMPGLRLGFMVLPRKILQQVISAKYTTDISTSGFTQRAFDLYMQSEHWKKHICMMRSIFKSKYKLLTNALDEHTKGYIKYNKPGGGLNLWLEFEDSTRSSQDFCNELIKRNVIITPGSIFSSNGENLPNLRISFADVDNSQVEKGVKAISELLLGG